MTLRTIPFVKKKGVRAKVENKIKTETLCIKSRVPSLYWFCNIRKQGEPSFFYNCGVQASLRVPRLIVPDICYLRPVQVRSTHLGLGSRTIILKNVFSHIAGSKHFRISL